MAAYVYQNKDLGDIPNDSVAGILAPMTHFVLSWLFFCPLAYFATAFLADMMPKDQSMAAMRDTMFAIFAFPSVAIYFVLLLSDNLVLNAGSNESQLDKMAGHLMPYSAYILALVTVFDIAIVKHKYWAASEDLIRMAIIAVLLYITFCYLKLAQAQALAGAYFISTTILYFTARHLSQELTVDDDMDSASRTVSAPPLSAAAVTDTTETATTQAVSAKTASLPTSELFSGDEMDEDAAPSKRASTKKSTTRRVVKKRTTRTSRQETLLSGDENEEEEEEEEADADMDEIDMSKIPKNLRIESGQGRKSPMRNLPSSRSRRSRSRINYKE
eukprot:TRINITY_DN12569_c0_g1_i8.p1 TRINITY_DN12569_c0_g1~~TRINITY_DN12569_c0_g1_i8.p1  ORF type:complete len:368 (+),score=88.93 TRINITY_DN12569_c0_g1_i8:116-1105(+)